jgi:hypothetical protein
MIFSILICSLEKRANSLKRLMDVLIPQLNDEVEVLVEIDNGQKTIGKKRNNLLEKSIGTFLAYIDDDDVPSVDYVSKILNALKEEPDCCGIEGIITTNGINPKKFIHSIKYTTWFQKDNIYYRCPNHINPIRRDLAIQIKFPEINKSEDRGFSLGILHLLKKEVYISGPIYNYLYITRK